MQFFVPPLLSFPPSHHHHHHHFLMPIPPVGSRPSPPCPSSPSPSNDLRRMRRHQPRQQLRASPRNQPCTLPRSHSIVPDFPLTAEPIAGFFRNEKVFVTSGTTTTTVAFNVGRSVGAVALSHSHPICRGISKLPLPFLSSCIQRLQLRHLVFGVALRK